MFENEKLLGSQNNSRAELEFVFFIVHGCATVTIVGHIG